MLAAIPVTMTLMGELISCIVSKIAMPAVIEPPGELM